MIQILVVEDDQKLNPVGPRGSLFLPRSIDVIFGAIGAVGLLSSGNVVIINST